ncbi:UNVERIFIED_CONTAM: Transcription factor ILR3 [Sesamum latifolium]|uniref:Transcription factor ILR3 n=1 Tax=Sesamum latifolium TaxID=2727402 RepID=A0AAW2WSL9_9LAMI
MSSLESRPPQNIPSPGWPFLSGLFNYPLSPQQTNLANFSLHAFPKNTQDIYLLIRGFLPPPPVDLCSELKEMASPPPEHSADWVFDYALLADMPPLDPTFRWPHLQDALPSPTNLSMEFDDSFADPDCIKEHGSRKRLRSGASGASDSKAYKEKKCCEHYTSLCGVSAFSILLLFDFIIDFDLISRFQELSSILEPGRPPKMDKAGILNDAVRLVIQLREEAQKLKESHDSLQRKVNELKNLQTEKNELRDEKLKLKAEKEKLEEQVKALSLASGFSVHPLPVPASFAAPSPLLSSKLVPLFRYPGIPMWQFMPPTAVDTSEDHALRPPVA